MPIGGWWDNVPLSRTIPPRTVMPPVCPRCACVINAVRFDFVDQAVDIGCSCPPAKD